MALQRAIAGAEFCANSLPPQRTPHAPAYACRLTSKSKSAVNGAMRFIQSSIPIAAEEGSPPADAIYVALPISTFI